VAWPVSLDCPALSKVFVTETGPNPITRAAFRMPVPAEGCAVPCPAWSVEGVGRDAACRMLGRRSTGGWPPAASDYAEAIRSFPISVFGLN